MDFQMSRCCPKERQYRLQEPTFELLVLLLSVLQKEQAEAELSRFPWCLHRENFPAKNLKAPRRAQHSRPVQLKDLFYCNT